MDSPRYRINAPTAVSEIIDGEAVIMNLESGHYFSARGLAGALWEGIIAGTTEAELASAVSALWPHAAVDVDVLAFVAQLREHKLITPAAVATANSDVLASMLKMLAGQAYQLPVLDVFTDMEDLLLLDPIHDVGEAGWPMPMTESAAETH